MGCAKSKQGREEDDKVATKQKQKTDEAPAAAIVEAEPVPAPVPAPVQPKSKPDPKDYMFCNLTGEVKIKAPGSIAGRDFVIDNCKDCSIYLLDHCSQVTIDSCTNCRIFIGPTDGSVFLRDSKSCKCAFICRQLRTRDCTGCDLLLHCRTRPVIEESKSMNFGCYDLYFPLLPEFMSKAKLSVWHNFWSYIYDFTAAPGNWKLLAPDKTVAELFDLPQEVLDAIGPVQSTAVDKKLPIFHTYGDNSPPADGYVFVLFPPSISSKALEFVQQAAAEATLLRTNEAKVSADMAKQMSIGADWGSIDKVLAGGSCIGMEFAGDACRSSVPALADQLGALSTFNDDVGSMFRSLGLE